MLNTGDDNECKMQMTTLIIMMILILVIVRMIAIDDNNVTSYKNLVTFASCMAE